ncbi:AAA family ATPase, partial [Candidatus Bathyarchaeota archaeon]|nr:AAA family ATPase [Candidatus Bathyarchaeota archaeon]
MGAPQELEKSATNYALEAVRLDKQHSKGMAITMYQRAIETLLKLVQLYPEYNLNKVYIQRAISYQERIKALLGSATPIQSQEGANKTVENVRTPQGEKASYDELIVKEKPNVKWEEVVGLEHAKRAIKEAIVYPVERPDLFPL